MWKRRQERITCKLRENSSISNFFLTFFAMGMFFCSQAKIRWKLDSESSKLNCSSAGSKDSPIRSSSSYQHGGDLDDLAASWSCRRYGGEKERELVQWTKRRELQLHVALVATPKSLYELESSDLPETYGPIRLSISRTLQWLAMSDADLRTIFVRIWRNLNLIVFRTRWLLNFFIL